MGSCSGIESGMVYKDEKITYSYGTRYCGFCVDRSLRLTFNSEASVQHCGCHRAGLGVRVAPTMLKGSKVAGNGGGSEDDPDYFKFDLLGDIFFPRPKKGKAVWERARNAK